MPDAVPARPPIAGDVREGIRDGFLLSSGAAPFALTLGATLSLLAIDPWLSFGSSLLLFAGASQLAGLLLLNAGAGLVLVVVTIGAVNIRHVLYSASLAPHLEKWPLPVRLFAGFLLCDPVYALAISRFERPEGVGFQRQEIAYYFAMAGVLYVTWGAVSGVGLLVGGFIPAWVPLGLVIPLNFLLLLVPLLRDRADVIAALVGGAVAVLARPLPLGLGTIVGAVGGIVAGGVVLAATDRRARRRGESVDD